jgi:hypothetical protein
VVHYDPSRLNAYPASLGFQVERMNAEGFVNAIADANKSKEFKNYVVSAWRWYAVSLLRAITHKQWSIAQPEVGSETTKVSMQWLRNLVPASIRESISRRLAMRANAKRIQAFDRSASPDQWILECIERISDFDNSVIWDPIAFVRGDPLSLSDEWLAIESALGVIRMTIGQQDVR